MNRPLRCPACNKPFTPEPAKVCSECKLPILRGHKFTFQGGLLRHRHCKWPDSYLTPKEFIAKFGKASFERSMRGSKWLNGRT